MTVLLYQDYVYNKGVVYKSLCSHFGPGNVRFCDAADITGGILENARLFVLPGGADLFYCEKLDGAANKNILDFVNQGGTYLGICAGAYYACDEIEWAKNEKDPICGPRQLGFYKGMATGPVYEFIENGSFEKSWDAATLISYEDKVFPVLYSGGPVFTGDEDAFTLAHYTDLPGKPSAIVERVVGKGKAILCGPHIEQDASIYKKTIYRHLNKSYAWQNEVAARLEKGQKQQGELRQAILDRACPGIKRKDAA